MLIGLCTVLKHSTLLIYDYPQLLSSGAGLQKGGDKLGHHKILGDYPHSLIVLQYV